jgi:CubicO group peptidase (beta-lactamase class C family)
LEKKQTPSHEPWALGWLLRGSAPPREAEAWFGLRDQKNQATFAHAGVDTFLGAADPALDVAFVFNTTASPKSHEEATRLRNEVTNRVFAVVD